MSYPATVFTVMIAGPEDVQAEHQIIRDALAEWNVMHSAREQCVLLPTDWRTGAAPEMGGRPQAIINREVLERADLLVAVFWTRIGSPTGEAISGTVEEIQRQQGAGKPVMIYFSSEPAPTELLDTGQLDLVRKFRAEIEPLGLLSSYSSREEFAKVFPRHLHQRISPLCATADNADGDGGTAADTFQNTLSEEGIELLIKAAEDERIGGFLVSKTMGGMSVQAGSEALLAHGSGARAEAVWQAAIDTLFATGLADSTEGVVRLTREGYRLADQLRAERDPDD